MSFLIVSNRCRGPFWTILFKYIPSFTWNSLSIFKFINNNLYGEALSTMRRRLLLCNIPIFPVFISVHFQMQFLHFSKVINSICKYFEINTLKGLNFVGIKFSRFRGFRKNREIKSRRTICNWPSAKLNPHEKVWKVKLIREILIVF